MLALQVVLQGVDASGGLVLRDSPSSRSLGKAMGKATVGGENGQKWDEMDVWIYIYIEIDR